MIRTTYLNPSTTFTAVTNNKILDLLKEFPDKFRKFIIKERLASKVTCRFIFPDKIHYYIAYDIYYQLDNGYQYEIINLPDNTLECTLSYLYGVVSNT